MPNLSEILKSKILKDGISKAYIASALGVSEKTIENYMHGKRHPKPIALVKLAEVLDFSLSELSEQNVPRENGPVPSNKEQKTTSTLENLAESNNSLSRAQEIFAQANLILAKNNEALVSLLANKLTDGETEEMFPAVQPIPADLLELLAELGAGKLWKSKKAGAAELHRRFYANKGEAGIQTDGGTRNTR